MATTVGTSPYEESTGFYSSRTAMSSLDDTWSTPRSYYAKVDAEFNFALDAAALQSSTLVSSNWYGPDHPETDRQDAFKRDWTVDAQGGAVWLLGRHGQGPRQ